MKVEDFHKAPGHWILAKMGKRVLRPGGKELTEKLVSELCICSDDNIVEYAPGLGFTAGLTLACHPKSYVGVDADDEVIELLCNKLKGDNIEFINRKAQDTQLESGSKDKVYGEAMLTMHADHKKCEIIREANRILKKGGLYAIHEIGLTNVDDEKKSAIQKALSTCIRVNARPLTEEEWTELLEKEGFKVLKIMTNGMYLLEVKRLIDDEGFSGFCKICYNLAVNKVALQRILNMRKTFREYQNYMNAIAIVAQKV